MAGNKKLVNIHYSKYLSLLFFHFIQIIFHFTVLHEFILHFQLIMIDLSETSSLLSNKRYEEVFLSFRGNDTHVSFTSHLYASLQNAGITIFMDDY